MDIDRIFRGRDLFGEERVRQVVLDVLRVYERKCHGMEVISGFHVYLVGSVFSAVENDKMVVDDEIPFSILLDDMQVEQNTWILFEVIMELMEPISVATPDTLQERAKKIEGMLLEEDPTLYHHLNETGISSNIIIWLCTLFLYPFNDESKSFKIWDAVFQYGVSFCDQMVISMITGIRDQLLDGSPLDSFGLFKVYPPGVDVDILINRALEKMRSQH
eukprot:TRINITY_DN214_c0_g1_i3.p1 TRINITY_DN214_c0_g1~~TRINITY_DN214_c0_g1_i3.p1  ORF type:complete len:218 (-),score=47.13 TRINITY_DN214_c0_g1_i3:45-698(-)